MTSTPAGDHARRLLAQRLTQARTPDELQAIGRDLLDRYGTFRYAAEALLEAVLDGRPRAGQRSAPAGAAAAWLRTSNTQWAAVTAYAAQRHMAASDVIAQAANLVLADPPIREQAADLTARYGRGNNYGDGHTWRPDPAVRERLAELAADLGVSVSVLLRWGLDRKVET